eukprot:365535-Chlamydomonas_euryale.AAC.93
MHRNCWATVCCNLCAHRQAVCTLFMVSPCSSSFDAHAPSPPTTAATDSYTKLPTCMKLRACALRTPSQQPVPFGLDFRSSIENSSGSLFIRYHDVALPGCCVAAFDLPTSWVSATPVALAVYARAYNWQRHKT